MKNNSISFITCVNNEEIYKECCRYIDHLNVPDGYEIEKIPIRHSDSMASGYNKAMRMTESKYKVYLHENLFIINKNFIEDSLKLFDQDEKISLLGVTGTKVLPTNGVWRESKHCFGKIYESGIEEIKLCDFDVKEEKNESNYYDVQCVDGSIMVTQYDLPWREEIFNGAHFHDIAQCIEFKNAGYKVAVPKALEPWCVHDTGILDLKNDFEEYRKIFIENYSKDIFPLVSILIPTHNRPEYFKIALDSAISQTYKNIEIIVCDDSDDEKTREVIQPYLKTYKNIVYDLEIGLDAVKNWEKALSLSKGEYINMLMDDDIFDSEKINKMMNYYLQYPNVSVVTSYRQVIDKDGNELPSIGATSKLFEEDTIVDGRSMGKFVLSNMLNVIGEPTTVLYKREYYNSFHVNCNNEIVIQNSDISRSLMALEDGDCVYISNALSKFRIHEEQAQLNNDIAKVALVEWYNIILEYWSKNIFLNHEDEFKVALIKWIREIVNNLSRFSEEDKYKYEINEILNDAIKLYLNINK